MLDLYKASELRSVSVGGQRWDPWSASSGTLASHRETHLWSKGIDLTDGEGCMGRSSSVSLARS